MPRRYYRRRYGGYRKRRKWSPTFVDGTFTISFPSQTSAFQGTTLCANSSNIGNNVPVSTIIKAKNFKMVVDIGNIPTSTSVNNFLLAIMFLPQGFTGSYNLPKEHPEWILAWRTVDANFSSLQNVQISSRLARNLNSGDSIILFVSGSNLGTSTSEITVSFICTFVTCNN